MATAIRTKTTTAEKTKPSPKKGKAVSPPKMERYRLLRGKAVIKINGVRQSFQVQRDPKGGKPIQPIIETDKDLCKLFNSPNKSHSPKFEKLSGGDVQLIDPFERIPGETIQAYLARLKELQSKVESELNDRLAAIDTMDKEELEDFALTEDIDLGETTSLPKMKMIVKKALTTAPSPVETDPPPDDSADGDDDDGDDE